MSEYIFNTGWKLNLAPWSPIKVKMDSVVDELKNVQLVRDLLGEVSDSDVEEYLW